MDGGRWGDDGEGWPVSIEGARRATCWRRRDTPPPLKHLRAVNSNEHAVDELNVRRENPTLFCFKDLKNSDRNRAGAIAGLILRN